MPLIINCEKCHLVYETVAFTKPDGTTDGQQSKCPKCGNWNGRKYLIDRYSELLKKKK